MSDKTSDSASDAKPRAPLSLVPRIAYTLASLALLIGFFLPWIDIGNVVNISGFGLVTGEYLPAFKRVVLAFCPLLALLLGASAGLGFRATGGLAIGAGTLILGYGLFTIAYILFTMIDFGLWMVLLSAVLFLMTGLISRFVAARKSQRNLTKTEAVKETPTTSSKSASETAEAENASSDLLTDAPKAEAKSA